MAQIQNTKQNLRQSPQKILVSTMVQSTDNELIQLIDKELEKNVTLEVVENEEGNDTAANDDTPDDTSEDSPEVNDGEATPEDNEEAEETAATLSDEERGDTLTLEHEDDEPVDTSGNTSPDDEETSPLQGAASETSFRDDLKHQIDELDITEEERYLAYYIIDCIEDDGYLRRPLLELVDDLEFGQHHTTTEEDLEQVLVEIVQEELDPPGIGARNLRECLLLQLQEHKATREARLAYLIVQHAFEELSEKHYDEIALKLGITRHQDMVDALRVIRHLNPKPGQMQPATPRTTATRSAQIRPDFTIRIDDGTLVVALNNDLIPQVRINPEQEKLYADLQARNNTLEPKNNQKEEVREGVRFMRESLQNGRNFISALEQRQATLLAVMQAIVALQQDFFFSGEVEDLHPMTLQDVAERCDYDISTVSRVTNSKYADTPFGLVALKDLFTNAVGDSHQAALMEELRRVVESEDKHAPLTDEAITEALTQQGYKIARRTVMKYREALNIPVARLRREP